EIIVAMFFPVRGEQGLDKVKRNAFGRDDAGMLSDVAVIEDKKFEGSPLKVDPRLAMTDDERQVPENGKRIGTLAVEGGLALQVPLDELIIYPRDGHQLKQFLEETQGSVLLDDSAVEPNGGDSKKARGYLVRVNTARADTSHLSQLRALFGEKETLLASSPEALRIVALATQYRLEGFVVAVNPRLQFMSSPSTRDSGAPVIDAIGSSGSPRVFADDRFGVRRAWAYTALWDADTRRIPVAILDMGFAPNWDFRGFPSSIFQCNLEDRNLGDLLSGRIPCAPGAAVGPPTVGNSFFGAPSWHGTGVVTTAGGVLNNGWGSAGTGGQVVEPRLYKTGLRSYAFEMGLGMRKAAADGAAIINVSAGYPCAVVPTIGPDLTICDPAQRAAFCALASVAVHTAAALVCATAGIIPIFGIIACAHAQGAAAASTVACFATLLVGDPRGPLQDGVNFARARGVTVISIAGNQQNRASLGALCDVISCGPQDATRWRVVPGTLPGVLCAGAADNSPPYLNVHYFGPDVALWAPIGSTYFHPPTTASVVAPEGQVPDLDSFGGTSAAAPYIAGVAAMMEAINPNLNPLNPSLTPAQRAAIPDIIRATLVGTATPASALPPDPTGQRRNLIDAFRAVKAAATLPGSGVIPDFDAAGYDSTLGFDETTSTTSFDTPATGRFVSHTDWGRRFTGTILALPAGPGPGGVNFTDRDWYRVQMPPGPEGLYRRVVRLTQPRRDRFG
ncbi:MAG TPA: S8 family serine peptidase, partial [Pyrinomonadaceae bacterium]